MNVLSFEKESNVNHTNYYSTFAVEISNQEERINKSPPPNPFDKNIKIKRGRKSRDVTWQDGTGMHHIMVLGPKKQRRKKKKSPQECQCYGYINNIDNRVRALEDSTNINTLNLQNLSLQQLFQCSILFNMKIQNRLV